MSHFGSKFGSMEMTSNPRWRKPPAEENIKPAMRKGESTSSSSPPNQLPEDYRDWSLADVSE
jgi:hypothetical protein